MKAFVQWTEADARDYIEIDSSDWGALARKPVPVGGEVVDNTPGWMMDCNIQGISLGGADHYDLEDLTDGSGGVRAIAWWDDAGDLPPEQFHAEVWTLLPLGPDPKLGGAISTRQSRIIYAAPGFMAKLDPNMENTELRPWPEFVLPPLPCHGIWVSKESVLEHADAATAHGWREFTEGLDPSELGPDGFVKSQRRQGRYNRARGTITYFLHDTTLANDIHVAEFENEMEETDVAVFVKQKATVAGSSDALTHVWTTVAGSPNDANWPNGAYRCQFDVSSVMRVTSYGFLPQGGSSGHMARVNSGVDTDEQTWTQDESAFSGTGIKQASHTIDPGAGAAGDRFECLLACLNNDTMEGTLEVQSDDSDSFADGPWTAAAVDDNIDVKHASDPVMEVF